MLAVIIYASLDAEVESFSWNKSQINWNNKLANKFATFLNFFFIYFFFFCKSSRPQKTKLKLTSVNVSSPHRLFFILSHKRIYGLTPF